MTYYSILSPVFVQVALTIGLGVWMAVAKTQAVRSGTARLRDTALGQPAWPDRVLQVTNSYDNQFEMPVLFYVLAALLIVTGLSDGLMVGLAWAFVALRIVHAAIHTTSNYVPYRFYAFLAGSAVLTLMWVIFAMRVLASGN